MRNHTNENFHNKFQCQFCEDFYPKYYRPDPVHKRTSQSICYDCHIERQDLTIHKLRKGESRR